jgi:NAD dependent epimerase/dehydratase
VSEEIGYAGKRVLVTGAGGFIGSHLCEALVEEGARVRAFVRYNGRGDLGHLESLPGATRAAIEVRAGDVRDSRFVREAVSGCERVFHLAALIGIPYSYEAPDSYVGTNVGGTLNLLEAAREARVARVVHTSTSEVYGTARYTPIDEAHPLQPQSPYSASKIGADCLAESYHRSFGLPVVILRPFNTYGPRQSARAVIPTIASQLLAGRETVELGSLHPVRDLTFVTDTVRAFLLAGARDGVVGQVINVGHGEGISVGDLARLIMRAVGREVPMVTADERVRPEASEVQRLVAGAERAHTLLGWEPRVSLRAGLAATIEYVRARPSAYQAERYAV